MKKKLAVFPLILAACVLVAAGCGEKKGALLDVPQKKDAGAVAATVNGKNITTGEVDEELKHMTVALQMSIPPEQMKAMQPRLSKQALENLVSRMLLLQEAEKQGIKPDEKTIEERITALKSSYPSPEMFDKQLSGFGVSKERLRKEVSQNLVLEALIEKATGGEGEVTGEEIEEFYRSKPEAFKVPERIKASHILITSGADDDEAAKKEKRGKIEELKEQLEKGADFAKLAREHSACPSKEKGGDLGYVAKGQMVKPFEDAAFSLKKDDLSDVVETKYGFHLIKVTDLQEAKDVPLEEAKGRIEEFLKRQKKGKAVSEYLDKLHKSAKISYAGGPAS